MATNPMLQAVLLFQHHQTTTPYEPIELKPLARGSPHSAGTEPPQPFDPVYQPGAPKEPHHG